MGISDAIIAGFRFAIGIIAAGVALAAFLLGCLVAVGCICREA